MLAKFLIAILVLMLLFMVIFYGYVTYTFLYTIFTGKAPFVSSFDKHLKLMIGTL